MSPAGSGSDTPRCLASLLAAIGVHGLLMLTGASSATHASAPTGDRSSVIWLSTEQASPAAAAAPASASPAAKSEPNRARSEHVSASRRARRTSTHPASSMVGGRVGGRAAAAEPSAAADTSSSAIVASHAAAAAGPLPTAPAQRSAEEAGRPEGRGATASAHSHRPGAASTLAAKTSPRLAALAGMGQGTREPSRATDGRGHGPHGPRLLATSDPCAGYFPASAESSHGEVQLAIQVSADGLARPSRTLVEHPRGQGFGNAAKACAVRLRFVPARDAGGQPVAAEAKVALRFERS